jgi:hypothetical protein
MQLSSSEIIFRQEKQSEKYMIWFLGAFGIGIDYESTFFPAAFVIYSVSGCKIN